VVSVALICLRRVNIPAKQLINLGKTAIASHYIQTRKEEFDAVFWINACVAGDIHRSFFDIALKLGLLKSGEIGDQVTDAVLRWLNNPVKSYQTSPTESSPKARWLLVYHNANDLDLIKNFWPMTGVGSVILTSRDPLIGHVSRNSDTNHDGLTISMNLKPFTENEAEQFLHNMTRREYKSDTTAMEIVRSLVCLPLAITQMVAYMTESGHNFQESLNLLREVPDDDTKSYQYTMVDVMRMTLETLDSGARMLLNVLSFFDPDYISEAILRVDATHVKAMSYPRSAHDYLNARAALWKSSLVKRQEDKQLNSGPDTEPDTQVTEDSTSALLFTGWFKNAPVLR
jgi:hypothetical protein